MTEVAGDFYDFLNVSASGATILMADVSGHGVPAALIASMVRVAAALILEGVVRLRAPGVRFRPLARFA